ncbi:MAG: hydrolase Nlp/P60 [Lachnospiraceae bacterium]|nr:hydrolase Nlp/P60 [Lachnospiraceae bacterium]
MREHLKKIVSFVLIAAVALSAVHYAMQETLIAKATKEDDLKKNIDELNNQISDLNDNISDMEEQQEILEEEMDDLNAEIINTLTSIGMKEDALVEKEAQIEDKQVDIDATSKDYEEAKSKEEARYRDMVVRLRKMYEKGNTNTDNLNLLLSGNGLGDMLNRMDNVESIYEYDRVKMEEYETAKNEALDLWNRLEAEKTDLESAKASLEADKANLEQQKLDLDSLLAVKRAKSANYDAELKKAKQEASVAKAKLKQEQEKLRKLQQGNKNNDAANGKYETDYNSIIDGAEGSKLGKQVAKYACQFVGNPYVPGGTSLTNGADCSGFTYRVYADFGYSLPRTSTEQRSAGREVSYSEAQPGDIICYSGHVAIYIGGGKIVHASTQKTGIKVGNNAQYRPILSVRRIV